MTLHLVECPPVQSGISDKELSVLLQAYDRGLIKCPFVLCERDGSRFHLEADRIDRKKTLPGFVFAGYSLPPPPYAHPADQSDRAVRLTKPLRGLFHAYAYDAGRPMVEAPIGSGMVPSVVKTLVIPARVPRKGGSGHAGVRGVFHTLGYPVEVGDATMGRESTERHMKYPTPGTRVRLGLLAGRVRRYVNRRTPEAGGSTSHIDLIDWDTGGSMKLDKAIETGLLEEAPAV